MTATGTATAVLLLGILGAGMRLATRPRAEGLRRWIGRGAWSLYLVPGAFLGLGISLLFSLPVMVPLRGWFLAPGLALVFRYLAFGWSGAAIARRDLDPALIDDVVLGCVDPVGEAGGDIARAAALVADYGTHVPGVQINRFCASGLDAVNFAAAQVMSGQHDMAVGGGVESMSRAPYVLPRHDEALPHSMELHQTVVGWRLVNERMKDEWTASLGGATEQVAALVGATTQEVLFTSGASESLTLATLGCALAGSSRPNIVVSAVEHKAVLSAAELAGRPLSGRLEQPVTSAAPAEAHTSAACRAPSGPLKSTTTSPRRVTAARSVCHVPAPSPLARSTCAAIVRSVTDRP